MALTQEELLQQQQQGNSNNGNPNIFRQQQAVVQQTQQPQPVTRTTQMPVIDRNSPTSGMDAVSSMLTTPEQEEKIRKASVANQRIMAIGDALRHIGNIYNTVNGAPSQQFNSPVQEEQQRYEMGKALRDAANLKYYTYQQAKAAQDAKIAQADRDFRLKQTLTDAQIRSINDKAAEMIRHNKSIEDVNRWKAQQTAAYQMANLDERTRTNTARTKIMQQNANTNRERLNFLRQRGGAGGGMGEYQVDTTYDRDEEGRVRSVKKTRTVKTPNGQTSTSTTTKKSNPMGGNSGSGSKKKKNPTS